MKFHTLKHASSNCGFSWQGLVAMAAFVLMLGLLNGCAGLSSQQQAILDKYERYQEVDQAENKAGVFIERLSKPSFEAASPYSIDDNMRTGLRGELRGKRGAIASDFGPGLSGEFSQNGGVAIKFKSPKISEQLSENEKGIDAYKRKFYVVNAETLENIPVPIVPWTKSFIVLGSGQQSFFTGFIPGFNSEQVKQVQFILVCFQGVSKDESAELTTPPLFFVVDLNDYRVLTPTPRLLGDLLKKRAVTN